MQKQEKLTKLDEEFRIFEGYFIGNKGTIYNPRMAKLSSFPVIVVNGIQYRRANLICMVWIGKTKIRQNVGFRDGDKTNLRLENLYYVEPKRKKKSDK